MRIKAYTSYSEKSGTHYYRNFEVVSSLPEVGGDYEGYIVKSIVKVALDIEQGSEKVYDYDYYWIHAGDEDGDGTIDDYVAVEKEVKCNE